MRALAANGIEDVTVVTGFGADGVEEALRRMGPVGEGVRTLFNPFFAVADNIGSCFLARDLLRGPPDAMLLNGDTLFEPAVLRRALRAAEAPITDCAVEHAAEIYSVVELGDLGPEYPAPTVLFDAANEQIGHAVRSWRWAGQCSRPK